MRKNQIFLPFRSNWLMLSCLCLCCASLTRAQDVAQALPVVNNPQSIARTAGRTVSLDVFMREFQKVHGIYFSYQSGALKEKMVPYTAMEKTGQGDAVVQLSRALSSAGLTFEKVNKVFIIKPAVEEQRYIKENRPSLIQAPVIDFIVSGIVKDVNGPVAGVTVTEKGTDKVTTTNANGAYTLNVSGPNVTLVFSSIGYQSWEEAVSGKGEINVILEVGRAEELSNVVVTALGISRNKKTLGYAISEVKADDIVKASNPNLLKSLDGKVSGVNFTSLSSDPTSSVLVNIRGTTAMPTKGDGNLNVSVKGQPLYVIDGIPVGTQTFTNKDNVDFGNIISQLNPEDIDNITILKGGSAGALYGAEGGNGVVMITTKSGKGGKRGIGVSFTSSATVDQPYQFINNQLDYGQGERGFEWQYDNTDSWGPKLDGSFSSDYWDVLDQTWKNKPMTSYRENRLKAYLQNGNTITNSISVKGNYDKGAFRLSMSNMDNKGVMPNTKTDQKTISLNTEYKLTDKLKVSVSASYIRTFSPNKANSAGSNGVINALLFNFPANLQPISQMKNYWLNGYDGIQQNGAIMNDAGEDVETDNPWWTTYENIHRFSRDNYFGKIQLDWQLSRHFSLLLRTGIENVKEAYEQRQSWGQTNLSNKFSDGDGRFVIGSNGSMLANTDAILSYNNTFGKFSVALSGGMNYAYSNSSSIEATAIKLATPELFNIGNAMPGLQSLPTGLGTPDISQSYSGYATATLGYNNQLFLDLTGRKDLKGISVEQKISYFYPSVSLGWVASETLNFPDFFNLVKLRGAWADVGNGLVRSRSRDTYYYESSNWGSIKTVGISASLVDPEIKAMHSITKEIGVDLAVLNNRIRFDFTYFIKDQKDQLGDIPTVRGTGFGGMLTNIGDVRSKGFEWGLSVTPVKTKNFSWDLSASFTHYKAKIISLSDKFAPPIDGQPGYIFVNYGRDEAVKIAVGEEIGNIYERNSIVRVQSGKYAGIPLLDGEAGKFQEGSNEKDRGKLGNFNPDYILGLNTTVRFKQFSLGLVGSFRKGGKYISVNQKYMESNGLAFTTLGSGPDNPYWMGGRDAANGGLPWPAVGASQFEAVNNYNDGNHSDWNDAGYARGVFVNPDFTGDNPTDADYIVNGADPNNTFYDYAYNAFGDVIWGFSSTRQYSATNFKMREISLSYTVPSAFTRKYKADNVTLSFIARNALQWNESGRNEDPETAFTGLGVDQGILRATLPSIRSFGLKLSLNF